MKKIWMAVSVVTVLAGCAAGSMMGPAPKDGELAMPSDYKTWPTFLLGTEKSTGHVRDIYINKTGATATKGQPFPNGTVSVMEIYKASKNESGKMVKGELEKVFVMYKGKNWGSTAPEGLKNGDWVYGSFDANGQPAKADYNSCRGCHLPLADKDFIFHYDKYFETRASLNAPSYASLLEKHAGLVALNTQEAQHASQVLR